MNSTTINQILIKVIELLEKEEYSKALHFVSNSIKLYPNNANLWLYKALALGKLKRFRESIQCFNISLEKDPKDYLTYYNKGVILEEMRNNEEALENFQRTLEIKPIYLNALVNKSKVLGNLKRHEEVIKCSNEILKIDPNSILALNNKGVALEGLGQLEKALEQYDVALKIAPHSNLVLKNKALVLESLERFEEAEICYDEGIQIDSNLNSYSNSNINTNDYYPWSIGGRITIFDSFVFERIDKNAVKDNYEKTRYNHLPEITSGGMGKIFFVRELLSNDLMVIKIPKKNKRFIEKNKRFIDKFANEAKILLTIKPHINIVECFVVETLFDKLHIFMECVEGGDLRKQIDNQLKDWELQYSIIFQIANGMSHAHNHGLIHRDLKPDNILVNAQKGKTVVKVSDFGIAKFLNLEQANEGNLSSNSSVNTRNKNPVYENDSIFTQNYASPEQWFLKSSQLGKETDIFSFGIIVYEIFFGKRPFDSVVASIHRDQSMYKNRNNTEILSSRILDRYNEGLENALSINLGYEDWQNDLQNLIKKCLKINLNERYSSFEEIIDDLYKIYRKKEKKEYQLNYNNFDYTTLSTLILLYSIRAKSLENLGFIQEAKIQYHNAININAVEFSDYVNQALCFDDLNKFEDAIKSYDKALKLNSKDPRIWMNKGVAFDHWGKHEEAIKCYDQAISLDPNNPISWNNKGVAYNDLKDYENAIKCFEKVFEITPRYLKAYNNITKSLQHMARYEDAMKYIDKAIKINPYDIETYLQKGVLLFNLKKYDESIKRFRKVLKLDPENKTALYMIDESQSRMKEK